MCHSYANKDLKEILSVKTFPRESVVTFHTTPFLLRRKKKKET